MGRRPGPAEPFLTHLVRVPSGGNDYTLGFLEPGSYQTYSPKRTTGPLGRINIRKKIGQISRFESRKGVPQAPYRRWEENERVSTEA